MIGHRPMCALASATRFAEFPRQERINSLRQHLIRYELFPARRDPETAPIRMEELKGLVRKWKLHHERNFWRNHQSKDQVVNALHAHMRERRRLDELKKEIAEKRILLTQQQHGGAHGPGSPHKQLAGSQTPDGKSRRHQTPPLDGAAGGDGDATKARRSMEAHPFDGRDGRRAASADDALAKGREHADDDEDASAKSTWTPLHERADDGKDFWANADQAMIYLSRGFGNDFERIDPRSPPPRKPRTDSLLSNGDPDGTSTAAASALITATEDAAGGGGSGAATPQLAGGAGGAGGGDAKADDVDDAKKLGVKRKCSNALLNMSTNDRMKAQFIEQGGLKALLHLGLSTPDHEVVTNCTACLVNLIAFGDYYEPFQLLEAGVVPALVKIAHAFGVGAPFGYDARIIQYCALSLCALSAQNEIEEWLIRDGLVPALTRLLRSGGAGDGGTVAGSGASVASGASGASADGGNGGVATNQFTRQVATKALVNIVCVMEGNQAESLVKNVMNTLADIVTHTPTLEARQLCADAIKSLSCLPVARPILQKQGVIATIKAILIGSKRAETTNACCIALCNMGMLHNCRKEMLSLGVIKLLSRLLKVGRRRRTTRWWRLCVLGVCVLVGTPRPARVAPGRRRRAPRRRTTTPPGSVRSTAPPRSPPESHRAARLCASPAPRPGRHALDQAALRALPDDALVAERPALGDAARGRAAHDRRARRERRGRAADAPGRARAAQLCVRPGHARGHPARGRTAGADGAAARRRRHDAVRRALRALQPARGPRDAPACARGERH